MIKWKKTAMFIWKLVIIMGHFHIPSQYVKNTVLAYNSLEKLVKYFYKTTREVFLCQKNAHTFNYMQPNNWKHIAGLHSATSNKKHLLSSWRKEGAYSYMKWLGQGGQYTMQERKKEHLCHSFWWHHCRCHD